jgi:hypothetical protein
VRKLLMLRGTIPDLFVVWLYADHQASVPRDTLLVITLQRASNLPCRLAAGGAGVQQQSPNRTSGEGCDVFLDVMFSLTCCWEDCLAAEGTAYWTDVAVDAVLWLVAGLNGASFEV